MAGIYIEVAVLQRVGIARVYCIYSMVQLYNYVFLANPIESSRKLC